MSVNYELFLPDDTTAFERQLKIPSSYPSSQRNAVRDIDKRFKKNRVLKNWDNLNKVQDYIDLVESLSSDSSFSKTYRLASKFYKEVLDGTLAIREYIYLRDEILKRATYRDGKIPMTMPELIALGQKIFFYALSLTPVGKTGSLRESAYLKVYNGRIEIGYNSPYAVFAHEDMNASHSVGRAKFLELALIKFLPVGTALYPYKNENKLYASLNLNLDFVSLHTK